MKKKYQEERKYLKYRELTFLLRQLPFAEKKKKEIITQIGILHELTKPGIPIPVLPWVTRGLTEREEIAFWRAVNQILRRPVPQNDLIKERRDDMRCQNCDGLIIGFWAEGFSWDAEFAVVCQEHDCGAVVAVQNKEHIFIPGGNENANPCST